MIDDDDDDNDDDDDDDDDDVLDSPGTEDGVTVGTGSPWVTT